ncbi:secreted RxLR effector protein 161-like [Nicotiana tabacum]|uniref:Secreted RxLR effector protein 161-like n=1 Tax=Nicotiana tabacum TaxID=4097 RepID=A0AC58TPW8_TOBAC
MVIHVDDILLATNDLGLMNETKQFLSRSDMKDLSEASFVLGIEIKKDKSHGLLGLSQRSYIESVIKTFNMQDCRPGVTPVVKGDKLSKDQCPKNKVEMRTIKDMPYACVVGCLMYIQVCTRPDIAFAVNMLGRFSSNPGWVHWVAAKKVMRYLQRIKDFMLVYKKVDDLDLLVYSDYDFVGCQDTMKSTSGYIFMLGGGAIS